MNRTKRKKKSGIKSTEQRKRLSVFKSNLHIYAQIIDDSTGTTLASASSLKVNHSQTCESAKNVGVEIAKLALEKKIENVIFDRGNSQYKGRVKAVAEGAREAGLKF